jgi:hypothetical protein
MELKRCKRNIQRKLEEKEILSGIDYGLVLLIQNLNWPECLIEAEGGKWRGDRGWEGATGRKNLIGKHGIDLFVGHWYAFPSFLVTVIML